MRYVVGFLFGLALLALPFGSSAQSGEESAQEETVMVESVPDEGAAKPQPQPDSLSVELRFRVFTNAFRWSSFRDVNIFVPSTANRSQYGVPGIGARFYPKGGHGVLVDVDYRIDLDLDYTGFCLFGCPAWLRTDFVVAHAGYAYRHIIPSPRKPGRRAWAFTGHGSFSAGASLSSYSNADEYARQRSPVVGARFGVDIDLHIKRFFMGWILRYEILSHTKGWLRTSQFFSFNLVPIFAIGASIGREVVPGR